MKRIITLTAAALMSVASIPVAADGIVTITATLPQDTPMKIVMMFVNETAPGTSIEFFRQIQHDPSLANVTINSVLKEGTQYVRPIIPAS